MTASVFAVVAVVGVAAPAGAAPAYPHADGRCLDQTGVLGRDLCAKVTAILLRDEKSASDEIAVAVVPTTGDASIEQWSTGLFNTWGVGKKDKNNGVLLVVAIDDHEVRLEAGRGTQDRLDDSDAATIVDDVTSRFAEDEYALGILTGLDDIRRQLGHPVPGSAELAALATTAPAPTETDAASGDTSEVWTDDVGISSDGSEFTSEDDFAAGDDSGFLLIPIAVGGFAVIALLGFFISRVASGSTGTGPASFGHHDSTRHATWVDGTTGSATSASSSFDSSGGSGSSFGGGSSDGGGATGSW